MPVQQPVVQGVEGQGLQVASLAQVPVARPSTWLGTNRGDAVPTPASVPLSRWSASAWIYSRAGGTQSLAPGGLLGGSQAGARLRYRLAPLFSLTARLSTPRHPAGAEASLGVEWQPVRTLPLRFLAERRQALGPDARNAFALTLHGGVSELPLAAGLRLDAYGQTGVVGARARDLFVEGAAHISRPVGSRLSLGAGTWAAAQPGAHRLDLGPTASFRLPSLGATVSADWRLRVVGAARPGSGPALTLQTDF